MANIVELKDSTSTKCYPLTKAKAVYFDDGTTVDDFKNSFDGTYTSYTVNQSTDGFIQTSTTRVSTYGRYYLRKGEYISATSNSSTYKWFVEGIDPITQSRTSSTSWLAINTIYTIPTDGTYRIHFESTTGAAVTIGNVETDIVCTLNYFTANLSADEASRQTASEEIIGNQVVSDIKSTYVSGYIDPSGTIVEETGNTGIFFPVITSDYIDVNAGDKFIITFNSITYYQPHYCLVGLYDKYKTFLGRKNILADSTIVNTNYTSYSVTDTDVKYIRISLRNVRWETNDFRITRVINKPEEKIYIDEYIRTDGAVGDTINTNYFYAYNNWICEVFDCSEGETFLITGSAGTAGRLWAFVDSDSILLSSAVANASGSLIEITAPSGAVKLIFNSNRRSDYSVVRGNQGYPYRLIARSKVQDAPIINLGDLIAKPTVEYVNSNIQEDTTTACTKYGIFKDGDKYCITYAENIPNDDTDYPDLSETGRMRYRYRYFKLTGETESSVTYGDVAKKGTTYVDINDTNQTMTGGVSYGSSVNGRLYFATAFNNTTDGVERDCKPCTCTVTFTTNGVTIGTIYELKLVVDGTTGMFNASRLCSQWVSEYYTSCPPCYQDGTYYWLIPLVNGIAYLTSTDGITWTHVDTISTPFYPMKEVTCVKVSNYSLMFAARSEDNDYNAEGVSAFIGMYHIGSKSITKLYRLPMITARPFLVKVGATGNAALLFLTTHHANHTECYLVREITGMMSFTKLFDMYKYATLYTACYQDNILDDANFSEMYIVGGNGTIDNHGSAFIKLAFDTSKPKFIQDIDFAVV